MKKIILLLVVLLVGCSNNTLDNDVIVEKDTVVNEISENQEVEEVIVNEMEFQEKQLTHYDIDAVLETEKSIITANQKVVYTHTRDTSEELYFHLYPNAFSKDGHPTLFDSNVNEIKNQEGYLIFKSIKINGEDVNFAYEPIGTVVKIDYNFENEMTYTIDMVYEVGISPTSERFGIVNGIYNLGNWYPVLAVYDEDGWNLDPYLSIGDPFYSEVSNYDVKITVPKDYIVAGSGYISDIRTENNTKTYVFRTERMRDFALVISDQFQTISTKVNDTEVILYYPEAYATNEKIDDALDFGAGAIELFHEKIGAYPYPTYSVVLTNFPSGMEYPGLVMISTNYLNNSIDRLRTVIVHETVHQWFYGIIGDDEVDEGWIDEGLTSYFTAYYDLKTGNEDYYYGTIAHYTQRVESHSKEVIINLSAYEFDNWDDYGVAAYSKPAIMYEDLYSTYGEELMLAFVQKLYADYSFGILKEEDLLETLELIYGSEVFELLDNWLN